MSGSLWEPPPAATSCGLPSGVRGSQAVSIACVSSPAQSLPAHFACPISSSSGFPRSETETGHGVSVNLAPVGLVHSCRSPLVPTASCALLYLIAPVTLYCRLLIRPSLTSMLVSQKQRFCFTHFCILSTFTWHIGRTSILGSRIGDCSYVCFVNRLLMIPTLTLVTMICTQVRLRAG